MGATFVGQKPTATLGINDVVQGEFYVITDAPVKEWCGALIMGTVKKRGGVGSDVFAVTVSSTGHGLPASGTFWYNHDNRLSLRHVANVTITE